MTNDMSRLREEIGASRLARRTFMQKDVAGALAGVHDTLVVLRDGVEDLLADFGAARRKVTKASHAGRRAFVADLQDKVVGLRKEVANLRHVVAADLNGARVAFFGPSASRRQARKPVSRRSRSRK